VSAVSEELETARHSLYVVPVLSLWFVGLL